MSKFFGLLACIGTVAIVSACGKAPAKKDYSADVNAKMKMDIEQILKDTDQSIATTNKLVGALQICRKAEADQKISEAAEANAISAEITSNVQDTNVVNAQCKGKDVLLEKKVYEAFGLVIITGPQITAPFTSVEIESSRTCAKIETSNIVADVMQSKIASTVVEADGDVRIGISTSVWKTGVAMPVVEGKNLLKIKYFNCAEKSETVNDQGVVSNVCVKNELVAEKELVLNVAIKQNIIEGVRTEEGCLKK